MMQRSPSQMQTVNEACGGVRGRDVAEGREIHRHNCNENERRSSEVENTKTEAGMQRGVSSKISTCRVGMAMDEASASRWYLRHEERQRAADR